MTSPIQEAVGPYLELLALLRPAARFVLDHKLKLSFAKKAFEAALLEEARFAGLGLRALGRTLGFGPSKAFSLGRLRHRELPESCLKDPNLAEVIEAILCLGALTPAKLNQFLPQFKYSEIQGEVQGLVESGRIARVSGLLHLPPDEDTRATHLFFEVLSQTVRDPLTRGTFTLPYALLEQWITAAKGASAAETSEAKQVEVCLSWMPSHL